MILREVPVWREFKLLEDLPEHYRVFRLVSDKEARKKNGVKSYQIRSLDKEIYTWIPCDTEVFLVANSHADIPRNP